MSRFKNLIHEAHRRSLWQVLGIYLVSGYVVYEAVQSLTEGLGLPTWFPALAIVLLMIGLPVVLATAFIQEGSPLRKSDQGGDAGAATVLDTADGPVGGADDGTAPTGSGRTGAPAAEAAVVHGLLTWRNALMGGLAAGALWGLVATFWLVRGGPAAGSDAVATAGEASLDKPPAIAVLPFANMSPDADFAFFADGVHEDILTNLSKVRGLIVLSRTSVLQYRDTEKTMGQIGGELGVNAILEGSVRRFGNQVRITTQLIDAESDAHLWAETYDRQLDDVFAVQTEIATEVAKALHATLTPDEERRIASVPTEDLTAYDVYLEGRQAYNEYRQDENEKAIRLFKQAIGLDPEYAIAWAGLGDAYAQYVGRWGGTREWADSSLAAGRLATELDPESSEAFKALALGYWLTGQRELSDRAHERALELNPSNALATNNLGVSYADAGEWDRAIPLYAAADRLDPVRGFQTTNLSLAYGMLSMWEPALEIARKDLAARGDRADNLLALMHYYYARGEADSVMALSQRRVDTAPSDPGFLLHAGGIAIWAGEMEAAEAFARDAQRINPGRPPSDYKPAQLILGHATLVRGDSARAAELLESNVAALEALDLEGGPGGDDRALFLAAAFALLGRQDEALDWLEESHERAFMPLWILDQEPAIDPLRGTPRFEALRERIVEREAQMRANVEAANVTRRRPVT